MHYDVTLHDIIAIINHCIQHIVILYQAPRGFIYFKLVPSVQTELSVARSQSVRGKNHKEGDTIIMIMIIIIIIIIFFNNTKLYS